MPVLLIRLQIGQDLLHVERIAVMQTRIHREKLPIAVGRTQAEEARGLALRAAVELVDETVEAGTGRVHVVVAGHYENRNVRIRPFENLINDLQEELIA